MGWGHSGDLTADFAPVVGNLTPRFVKSPVFPHPPQRWGMKLTSALEQCLSNMKMIPFPVIKARRGGYPRYDEGCLLSMQINR